jgi:hypothetical protein
MSGSGASTPQWGLTSTLSEDARDRLVRECERRRVELMGMLPSSTFKCEIITDLSPDQARSLSSASVDCIFDWTFSGFAKDLPGIRSFRGYGGHPWDLRDWDTLDLGTLKRAFDKGQIRVRAWDEHPRPEDDRPAKEHRKQFDVLTRTMRQVGMSMILSPSFSCSQ